MAGWIILIVLVTLIAVLLCLRVGMIVRFGDELRATVFIGPKAIQIIPALKEKPKRKTEGKESAKGNAKPKKKWDLHLTFDDICGALKAVWQSVQGMLRRAGKRIRVTPLDISIVLGDEDPVNTAQWYGWVNTAVWTVMPRLEQWMNMPDPRVHIAVDFDAVKTKLSGTVGLRCRTGDLLAIGLAAAGPLLRFGILFLKRQRAMKKATKRAAREAAARNRQSESTPRQAA